MSQHRTVGRDLVAGLIALVVCVLVGVALDAGEVQLPSRWLFIAICVVIVVGTISAARALRR